MNERSETAPALASWESRRKPRGEGRSGWI